MRYREAGIVGYGRKTVGTGADAITVLDLANPYTNDDEIFLDAFLAYRGTLFGDVDYRVQLNVRNLLDNSDLYVTDRSTTGRNLVWAGYEPRTFAVSLDLDF